MALLEVGENLTRTGSSHELDAAITHKGQAHFADPSTGHRCGACVSYKTRHKERMARCEKYAELAGKIGNQIPPTATACKYFRKA